MRAHDQRQPDAQSESVVVVAFELIDQATCTEESTDANGFRGGHNQVPNERALDDDFGLTRVRTLLTSGDPFITSVVTDIEWTN